MATVNQNLSSYNPDLVPSGSGKKVGIVVSEWNGDITNNLLNGALEALAEFGVNETDIIVRWVPGSFELPFGAQSLIVRHEPDAVICLGCVIRGETSHFDYVCQACSQGIMHVGLETGIPVIFGVLTDDTKQQSIDRSGGAHGNKGTEAAISALKMMNPTAER